MNTPTSKARQWADTLNRVALGGERIVVRRDGQEVAALVPIADLELVEEFENGVDLEAAQEALKESGTIPWEKVAGDLALSHNTSRAIDLKPAARRELRQLPEEIRARIAALINDLGKKTQTAEAKKLDAGQGFLRIRAHNYRVIYQAQPSGFLILSLRIGNRRI